MKFILIQLLALMILLSTLYSCEKNTSAEGPCMVHELSIVELEKQIDEMHQREEQLKQELESATDYIKLLEENIKYLEE